jgi:Tfp pilus assembly protein PilV
VNQRKLFAGSHPKLQSGITLIEVMVSLILVSTILLVSLSASASLQRQQFETRSASVGKQLAFELLDEITAMDFQDRESPAFGIEADEIVGDRSTFDDVDDYHNYSSTPPKFRDGTEIASFARWTISVTVVPSDPDVMGVTTTTSDSDSPLRIVNVICESPTGETSNASALVSNVSNNLPSSTSYSKWQRTKLTFPGGREVHVTSPLRNHPEPSPY